MNIRVALLIAVFILASCVTTIPEPKVELSVYEQDIMDWHQQRNDRLNQPDGWLTLSGLFWLKAGENTIGAASNNDLVFPGENIPAHLGTLILKDDSVSIKVAEGIQITIQDSVITHAGLKKDSSGEPDLMQWGSLTWYIIERGEKIGVRLKDSKHPNYVNFKPTELFPVKETWMIEATLVPFDTMTTVDIINVLGDSSPSATPGLLHFEIDGQALQLTPLGDPEDEQYFIIFGDGTNGISTYGAGRFLVIPAADENGKTVIDFNKSYNMPCVFSPYATCPLPPEENLLSLEIKAGEMQYEIEGGH